MPADRRMPSPQGRVGEDMRTFHIHPQALGNSQILVQFDRLAVNDALNLLSHLVTSQRISVIRRYLRA